MHLHQVINISKVPSRFIPGYKSMPVFLLSVFSLFFSTHSFAQNGYDLRNLIFEPVLIAIDEIQPQEEEIELSVGELENETSDSTEILLKITELTTTPGKGDAISLNEALANILINSQPTINEDDSNIAISEHEEEINKLELEGGAFNQSLSEQLQALGLLYKQTGEYDKAIELFDRAIHVNRANKGLFTLDQEDFIQDKIDTHLLRGDLYAADLDQEYLFYLKQRVLDPSDPEMIEAIEDFAEWNILAFNQGLGYDSRVNTGADADVYTENMRNNSIGEENFWTKRLVNAQLLYIAMRNILSNNIDTQHTKILDIEHKLALVNFFFATNFANSNTAVANQASFNSMTDNSMYVPSRVSNNSMGSRHGREALERRIILMESTPSISKEKIIQAKLDLADWQLFFKKRLAAVKLYNETYQFALDSGFSEEEADKFINGHIPERLPNLIDFKFTRDSLGISENTALEYKGFIDVSFLLNRFGLTSNVQVINKSENVTDPIEIRLVRDIRASIFRPSIPNYKESGKQEYTLRYYYSY